MLLHCFFGAQKASEGEANDGVSRIDQADKMTAFFGFIVVFPIISLFATAPLLHAPQKQRYPFQNHCKK